MIVERRRQNAQFDRVNEAYKIAAALIGFIKNYIAKFCTLTIYIHEINLDVLICRISNNQSFSNNKIMFFCCNYNFCMLNIFDNIFQVGFGKNST